MAAKRQSLGTGLDALLGFSDDTKVTARDNNIEDADGSIKRPAGRVSSAG